MPDLPSEVVVDILSRLPVKPLLRFRCVSKPWCDLIDSPDFLKMHLDRSIQTRNNLSLILRDSLAPHLYSVGFDSLDRTVELDHPLKSEKHKTRVWGSCNGLLCLSNTEEDVVLWNPSTRKHLKLPVSPIETTPLYFCICKNVVYGFGYDSMNDDYKVLRIVQFHGVDDDFMDSEVMLYGLKSNSWKRVQNFPYYLAFAQVPGLLAGGALHWDVTVKPEVDDDEPGLIIAFDLGAEGFRIVPQPEYKDTNFHLNIGVLEGWLCVLCSYYQVGVDLWVMKEYGVKESWTKLMSIEHSYLIRSFDELKPITYSKNDGKVLFEHETHRFLWYDLERKTIEKVRIRNRPDELETYVCLGSLVPVDAGGGSDGEKQAARGKRKKKVNRKKRDDFLSEGFKLVL